MIVENKGLDKICSFYVSEFHLEMILVPYINEKLEKNERVIILTQKNLSKTIGILISKMNLNKENKQKILKLNWNGEEKIIENSNIIIIGSQKYIEEKNKEIKEINKLSVVDCYDFEEIKNNIKNIVNKYKKNLNTLGKENF